MKIDRRKTRVVNVGSVPIGGNKPVSVQSMAKTRIADIDKSIAQIKSLEKQGCEIVRVAVKDAADARAISRIKPQINIPLVADIHFNWRLAVEAIESGADKIRLNPGNIYKKEEVREIARLAKARHIPIRVGVNSGSLRRENNRRLSIDQAMVAGAMGYIRMLEGFKFRNIVVSLKGSDIFSTIAAYRRMSRLCDYPLHLGVTATGSPLSGILKSSAALSVLLLEGIGDTIRVSLTDQPEAEVRVARSLLEALGLRTFGPQLVSCPTCGRCEVDLVRIVRELEDKFSSLSLSRPLKVAVMGCVVNGPGEAREADIGIAFGRKSGLLFKKGKAKGQVPFESCARVLLKEVLKAK